MILVQMVGVFLLMQSLMNLLEIIHLRLLMKTVSLVFGLVVQDHILKLLLRCFFLLPATVATTTAVPAIEAMTAAIGHQDLAVLAPTTSTFISVNSIRAATPVRLVSLSVASSNNNLL